MEVTKTMITTALSKGLYKITFLKKDGTKRELIGTRNIELVEVIAPQWVPNGNGTDGDDNTVKVFVPELKEWRTFKVDRLLSMEPIEDSCVS